MMNETAEPYDVFLCFPYEARGLGDLVLLSLEEAGLKVFRPWSADVTVGERAQDARAVLAGSRAVVGVVLSGEAVDPTLVIAIGAANALGKPVFIITDDVEQPDLPPYIASLSVFPQSQVDQMRDAVTRVRRGGGRPGPRRVGSLAP